jgi:hypothetical protein
MEDLLRRLLKEYDEEKAFTTKEALFFKFLNTYKKSSNSTGAKVGDLLMKTMKSFALNPSEYQHYLNLYTQNYREDGRYDLTKKSELNQYHKLKSVRTSNQRAGDLVAELKPFKGNNLKANWEKDYKGGIGTQYLCTNIGDGFKSMITIPLQLVNKCLNLTQEDTIVL